MLLIINFKINLVLIYIIINTQKEKNKLEIFENLLKNYKNISSYVGILFGVRFKI